MEGTKSCSTRERDLKGKQHPGKRIKIIREAKNRAGDSKGKFGQNDFCKLLTEKGALDGSDQARRIYKQFESGARDISADQEPIPTVLSLLEVTPEFAGYNEELGVEKDTPRSASGDKTSKNSKKPSGPSSALTVKLHNYLEGCELTILIMHSQEKNEMELFVYPGDMRVPNEVYADKISGDISLKEIWVRDKAVKFGSEDKEVRLDVPGRAKAVLS